MENKPNPSEENQLKGAAKSANKSTGNVSRNVPKRIDAFPSAGTLGGARSVPLGAGATSRVNKGAGLLPPPKKDLSQSLKADLGHPLVDVGNGASGGAGGGASSGQGNKNADSPDSGSLYSNDEIPSGYNSGEQYDTISTGYMSGEAYELPDTRMDLREPTLDVIEESGGGAIGGGTGGGAGTGSKSDEDDESDGAFMVGPPPSLKHNSAITGVHPNAGQLSLCSLKGSIKGGEENHDCGSSSTSDQDQMDGIDRQGEMIIDTGPGFLQGSHSSPHSMPLKSKLRKKTTTFAVPIEASPLTVIAPTAYEESSDAAVVESAVGGYRAVPSDTDTSAMDSDANAIMTDQTGTDSGNERGTLIKQGSKKSRRKERKRMEEHDDAWFMAHDNKYWSATRFICFWGSIAAMIGATLAAAVLIFLMPKNCDPHVEWYHGTVTLDIHLDSLPIGDAPLAQKIDSYSRMGIQTLHLRNITGGVIPTSDLVGRVRWAEPRLRNLTALLHARNMTLMVQVPVVGGPNDTDYTQGSVSLRLEQEVETAIKFFMEVGSDGVFLDGLEHFGADEWVANSVMQWKRIIDRFGVTNRARIMMTSYKFAQKLDTHNNEKGKEALKVINLLDATFDMDLINGMENNKNNNFTVVSDDLASVSAWDSIDSRPWINWNLKSQAVPLTNAARALQMLLPGTININHPSGQSDEERLTGNMSELRAVAVPIYMNGNYKPCHVCQDDTVKETNYHMHQPIEYVVQLERFYSRRHRYVLVANFGANETSLAEIGRIYSGGQLVLDTTNKLDINADVLFSNISLPSGQAVVIKLPK